LRFAANFNGDAQSFEVGRNSSVGELKARCAELFKLKSCGLVGLQLDDVPVSSLRGQSLFVVDPVATARSFSVAPVLSGLPPSTDSVCSHCRRLLKRVAELTNLVFLHDHSQCRDEQRMLGAEVERLRARTAREAELRAEVQDWMRQLASAQSQLESGQQLLSQTRQERDELTTENDALRGRLEDRVASDARADKLEARALAAEAEAARLRGELDRTKADCENLKHELAQIPEPEPPVPPGQDEAARLELVANAKKQLGAMTPQIGVLYVSGPAEGVLVTDVRSDLPAERCGLLKDDVVEEVRGKPTHDKAEFANSLDGVLPGDVIPIQILRKGEVHTLLLTVGAKGYSEQGVKLIRRMAAYNPDDFELTLSQLDAVATVQANRANS